MSIHEQIEATKTLIISSLLDREGGYVNNPRDSGGQTRWGVTEEQARRSGYMYRMCDLPFQTAVRIIEAEYWVKISGDNLASANFQVAEQVLDFAVLSGVTRSAKALQRCLNLLNFHQRIYPDIAVDGVIGSETLKALGRYIKSRDVGVLIRAFNITKGAHFMTLAEQRKKDEEFIYGWLKNRIIL